MEDPVENGIVNVGPCRCGHGTMRMHTWLFKNDGLCRKHYVDCTSCSRVTDWHMSADEAIAEFNGLEENPTELAENVVEVSEEDAA